jgi:hypothetical protein
VRCSEEEHVPWLPQANCQVQPHDAAAAPQNRKDNYLVAPHSYRVETIRALARDTVIARTLPSNGAWNIWKEMTRFIVDSYHISQRMM